MGLHISGHQYPAEDEKRRMWYHWGGQGSMLVPGKAEDRRFWTSGQGDKLRGKLYLFPVLPRKTKQNHLKAVKKMTRALSGRREEKKNDLLLSGAATSDSFWLHGRQQARLPSFGVSRSSLKLMSTQPSYPLPPASPFAFKRQAKGMTRAVCGSGPRAQGSVWVSNSHPSGHTVGQHVSVPASTVSPMLWQWKCEAWPGHLQTEALCGQPCSLLLVVEGGGCPRTQGNTWTEPHGREVSAKYPPLQW